MKSLFIILLFVLSTSAFAGGKRMICTMKYAKTVVPIAEAHSQYDKNRHCSVSCMLALTCNDNEVLLAGILKEVRDVFGPGEADREDIIANRYGIALVSSKRAKTYRECLEQCDLRY